MPLIAFFAREYNMGHDPGYITKYAYDVLAAYEKWQIVGLRRHLRSGDITHSVIASQRAHPKGLASRRWRGNPYSPPKAGGALRCMYGLDRLWPQNFAKLQKVRHCFLPPEGEETAQSFSGLSGLGNWGNPCLTCAIRWGFPLDTGYDKVAF